MRCVVSRVLRRSRLVRAMFADYHFRAPKTVGKRVRAAISRGTRFRVCNCAVQWSGKRGHNDMATSYGSATSKLRHVPADQNKNNAKAKLKRLDPHFAIQKNVVLGGTLHPPLLALIPLFPTPSRVGKQLYSPKPSPDRKLRCVAPVRPCSSGRVPWIPTPRPDRLLHPDIAHLDVYQNF